MLKEYYADYNSVKAYIIMKMLIWLHPTWTSSPLSPTGGSVSFGS